MICCSAPEIGATDSAPKEGVAGERDRCHRLPLDHERYAARRVPRRVQDRELEAARAARPRRRRDRPRGRNARAERHPEQLGLHGQQVVQEAVGLVDAGLAQTTSAAAARSPPRDRCAYGCGRWPMTLAPLFSSRARICSKSPPGSMTMAARCSRHRRESSSCSRSGPTGKVSMTIGSLLHAQRTGIRLGGQDSRSAPRADIRRQSLSVANSAATPPSSHA